MNFDGSLHEVLYKLVRNRTAFFSEHKTYKYNEKLVQESMSDMQVSCASQLVQVSVSCVTVLTVFVGVVLLQWPRVWFHTFALVQLADLH